MFEDWGLIIGLLGIAAGLISIGLAIFFGLRGFWSKIDETLGSIDQSLNRMEEHTKQIQVIKDKVIGLDEFIRVYAQTSRGTIEVQLENLGKAKISAEPGVKEVKYTIIIEKPVFRDSFLVKKANESEIINKEQKLFGGKQSRISVLSPTQIFWHVPSTDPKACTKFIGFVLKWLDTTYFKALKEIKEFEEPILDEMGLSNKKQNQK